MAAPTVLAEAWTPPSAANSTSFAITVPTGSAGDVVECEVGSTSNGDLSVGSGSGWHLVRQWKYASGLSGALFRKKTGTAGADSLTVASATSARFNAHTVRLPFGTRTFASPTSATATSSNSNPPSVDHLKSRETLYTAVRWGAGTVVPSAGPSGYGTRVNNAATSGGVSQSYAYKTATSSSDDPGTFTSSSALWGSITIARWIDTDGPSLNATKALLAAGTQDVVALAMGDSQEAGAVAIAGPTQTMGSNASAVCRNAIRATDLVAMPGSRACIGGSGGQTSPAEVKAWDTRLTADASFDLSDTIGAATLGGYAWTLGTAGQKISLALGEAFDRVEVCYFTAPASPQWTVDVNGGTSQTLTGMVAANGIAKTTLTLSGNSSAVINLTAPAAGAYVLYVRAYLTSTPRVHFLNMGAFGWTSTQLADASSYYSPRNAQLAVAADITFFTGGSNDTTAGIPIATTLDNLRQSILTGLATGEFCYTIPNYMMGGNEAAQDALWDMVADMCDELGAAVNRLTLKSGYTTSYAATVAAGNLINGNNHMTVQGHAVAGAHDVAMIEPPVFSVTNSSATHAQTATSPTLSAKSSVAVAETDHAHTVTEPSLAASGDATAVTPADASHGHAATEPALAAASSVAPDDAAHAHEAGSPFLAAASIVAPADADHAQAASSPDLAAASTVSPAGAAHDHAATSPALAAASGVAPADAAHGHVASAPSLAAGFTVAPAAAAHDHAASEPALVAGAAVSPADALQGHDASPPSVNAGGSLAVDSAQHGQIASAPPLGFIATVSPASAGHDQAASAPALAAQFTVSPADAAHGHDASSPSLTASGSLTIDGALHGQAADSPTLSARATVSPSSAFHGQAAASPALTLLAAIGPNLASHAHLAASPALSIALVAAPADAVHGHSVTSPQLWRQAALALVPLSRSIATLSEDRTIEYQAEDRTICAPFRGRSIEGRD